MTPQPPKRERVVHFVEEVLSPVAVSDGWRNIAAKLLFFLGVTAFLLHPALHVAQQAEGSASLKSFVGTWKGTCADGAEFLVLQLSQSGNEMAGTVSIANMNGANGRCAAVIDPPTEEHAMKIHDAFLRG